MSGKTQAAAPQEASTKRPDPLVGQVIAGRFRVEKVISRGSMGKVYLAEQVPLGRTVAVKVLDVRESNVSSGDFEQRFLREASTLARLNHPNTVRVFDYGIWEGRSYLVMEYVEGTTLKALMVDGGMQPSRAITILNQICGSLSEAHEGGVVHRDLKPSNVLLTRQGGHEDFVKVVDFGLVKDLEDATELTGDGLMLGSPLYMAPEQIRDEGVDQRTDIYALGIMLYRALMGKAPYKRTGTASVLVAHLTQEPPPFSEANPEADFPPCVEWTVMRCLEKNRENRYANVGELVRALQACQLALEEPLFRNIQLKLEEGQLIMPPELQDLTGSTSSIIRTIIPPQQQRQSSSIVIGVIGAIVLVVVLVMLGIVIGTISSPPAPQPLDTTPVEGTTTDPKTPDGNPQPTSDTPPSDTQNGENQVNPAVPPDTEEGTEPKQPEPAVEDPQDVKPAPRPVNPRPRPRPRPDPEPSEDGSNGQTGEETTEQPKPQPKTGGSDLVDPWATDG